MGKQEPRYQYVTTSESIIFTFGIRKSRTESFFATQKSIKDMFMTLLDKKKNWKVLSKTITSMNVNTAKTGFFSSTSGVLRSNAESAWKRFHVWTNSGPIFPDVRWRNTLYLKTAKIYRCFEFKPIIRLSCRGHKSVWFKLISKLLLRTDFKQFATTEFELKSTVIKKSQV